MKKIIFIGLLIASFPYKTMALSNSNEGLVEQYISEYISRNEDFSMMSSAERKFYERMSNIKMKEAKMEDISRKMNKIEMDELMRRIREVNER